MPSGNNVVLCGGQLYMCLISCAFCLSLLGIGLNPFFGVVGKRLQCKAYFIHSVLFSTMYGILDVLSASALAKPRQSNGPDG